jgi:cold shock CspA family protein
MRGHLHLFEDIMTGRIKHIVSDRGFFFIVPNGGGGDVFGHANQCDGAFQHLRVGDYVEYDEDFDHTRNKMRGKHIRLVGVI